MPNYDETTKEICFKADEDKSYISICCSSYDAADHPPAMLGETTSCGVIQPGADSAA